LWALRPVRHARGNTELDESCFLYCTASEELASDSAASKEKDREKEDLPFDDPVCITLEYFRYDKFRLARNSFCKKKTIIIIEHLLQAALSQFRGPTKERLARVIYY